MTDSGPGISEQEREAVLRRFYRSDKIRNSQFGSLARTTSRQAWSVPQ